MTWCFPFAVAQLLVKRIPPFRAPDDRGEMAVTPGLDMRTAALFVHGSQQDPFFILGHVPRRASRTVAFVAPPPAGHAAVRWAVSRESITIQCIGFSRVKSGSCHRGRESGIAFSYGRAAVRLPIWNAH